MQSDSDSSAAICSDLLSAYQGTVVHDLRGDLNGLLLTLDFLRRQLLARPETASLFGESMGDLDNVRGTLIRTLNQLEVVGQARRVVGGRAPANVSDQNLPSVIATVLTSLGERIRRRGVTVQLIQSESLAVRTDPVLLQLAIHRLVGALADISRNTEIRLEVQHPEPGVGRLCVTVFDASKIPSEIMSAASNLKDAAPPIPGMTLSMGLVMRLAKLMGGSVNGEFNEAGAFVLCLDLPVAGESAYAAS